MTRTESLLTVAVAIVATLALIFTAATGTAVASVPCMEDAPCWTWSRMGNHQRGVVTTHGTPLVVGPCRFARLYRAHVIRYSVTLDGVRYPLMDRLRGDAWALRHGCTPRTAGLPSDPQKRL